MYVANSQKGTIIKDFELVDENGHVYQAEAVISGYTIVVHSNTVSMPVQIRYCYRNTPRGGLIYNKAGLPMSPFVRELK